MRYTQSMPVTRGIKFFSAVTKDRILKETIVTHRKIADAIIAGDEKGAYHAMVEHLRYNEKLLFKTKNERKKNDEQ